MSSSKIIVAGIVGLSIFFTGHLCAQSSIIKQAQRKIDQGNWSAGYQILFKSIKKDTLNPEVELALSKWFLNVRNPSGQIDSAFRYGVQSMSHFRQLPLKQKEKLKRDQVDSTSIVLHLTRVDSAAFERAKQVNSEEAYNHFLDKFKLSNHKQRAVELRDEVAFLEVLRQNSYKGFETYIKKYPNSARAIEANQRYQKLLFESRVHDRKLKSYEAFIKEFPQSPYRKEADRNVFEILTSCGTVPGLEKFITEHPGSIFQSTARNLLFHIFRETDDKIPENLLTDSLKKVREMDELLWAPVFKNGKYGFIDSNGNQILAPQFESIDEDYKCAATHSDILMTSAGLVTRSGKVLANDRSFKDLGYGFIKIVNGTCASLMHKSGKKLIDCAEDVSVLEGQFIVVTKDSQKGLYALSGRELLPPQWQAIDLVEGLLILDRKGKKTLIKPSQLAAVADGDPLPEGFVFDEVIDIGKDRLLVRNGSLSGVINSSLVYEVPLAIQQFQPTPFGLVSKLNDQFVFEDIPELKNQRWEKYSIHRQWLYLRNNSSVKLFDTFSKKVVENNPDSLWFYNGLAFARKKDSVNVHINSVIQVSIPSDAKFSFIKSTDSIRYFFAEQKNKKTVYEITSGKKMFTAEFDQIESLGPDHFMLTKKNKKGVVSFLGRVVLPIEYDILIMNGKLLSVYKDKKFGLYDFESNLLIKPSSEKNMVPLDSVTLIVYQGGHYGFVDWSGKPIGKFEFDEIKPWSPSEVWVKKDFEWSLINFKTQKKLLSNIKSFDLTRNDKAERIAIVKQENLFGVVSSRHGVIIPPTFSFLLNLGNEEEPLYFTAKEVEEAGIVVVIYYDRNGKFLSKQVYEEEEYARIVCPQD